MPELASRIPAILEGLRTRRQLMIHGDASPQNLLVPAGAPDTFVAIDWTLGGLPPPATTSANFWSGWPTPGSSPWPTWRRCTSP